MFAPRREDRDSKEPRVRSVSHHRRIRGVSGTFSGISLGTIGEAVKGSRERTGKIWSTTPRDTPTSTRSELELAVSRWTRALSRWHHFA